MFSKLKSGTKKRKERKGLDARNSKCLHSVFPVPHHTSDSSHGRAVIFQAQIDKDFPKERHGTVAIEYIGHTLNREWKSKEIGFHLYYQRVRWTEGTQS